MFVYEAGDGVGAAVVHPGDHAVEEGLVAIPHYCFEDGDGAGETVGEFADGEAGVQGGLVYVVDVDTVEPSHRVVSHIVVECPNHIRIGGPIQTDDPLHIIKHGMVKELLPRHPILLLKRQHLPQNLHNILTPHRFREVHWRLFKILHSLDVFFWWVGWPTIEHLEDDDAEREYVGFVGVVLVDDGAFGGSAAVQLGGAVD